MFHKQLNSKKRPLDKIQLQHVLQRIDQFGRPLPTFNIKGSTSVPSVTGGVITLLLCILWFTYGVIKLQQLYMRDNPQVISFIEQNYYDNYEVFNANEHNFRLAWSVEDYLTGKRIDDPRYVKYLVRLFSYENGTDYERVLNYHNCTDDDFK